MAVSPTGSGKTVLFSNKMEKRDAPSLAIAHRQELVGQMSMALCNYGLKHKIIAPKKVVKSIIGMQIDEFGRDFYDPNSWQAVGGVRTIASRANELDSYLKALKFWIIDEAHHVTQDNEWGRAVQLMPEQANGFLVTATPLRADGVGLGRWCGGVADKMVIGPTMRHLINKDRLTDFKIYAPEQVIKMVEQDLGSTGDYKQNRLKAVAEEAADEIVGDIVENYLRYAPGKRGVTFVTDISIAVQTAKKFNDAGVPAEVITSKTPDDFRVQSLKKFRAGQLLQLINVDLFTEGFDVPAIEVVSMARPTMSWALFIQQFGRALRKLPGKERAIIIDHVGNVIKMVGLYGRPDEFNDYTLEGNQTRTKDPSDQAVPMTVCKNKALPCLQPYERYLSSCPYCGYRPVIADRSEPEFVDGDLTELDLNTLIALQEKVDEIDKPVEQYNAELLAKNVPWVGREGHTNRHIRNQTAQAALRESIAYWAGFQRQLGRSDSEGYRRFYHAFNIDVMNAKALKEKEAHQLAIKINHAIGALANGRT